VGGIPDAPFPLRPGRELFDELAQKDFPVLDDAQGRLMQAAIAQAAAQADSVGGVVECAAVGLPAGLGEPMFDGVENRLAAALFGIPAVKGVEFGAGFAAAAMKGSEHNDTVLHRRKRSRRHVLQRSGGIQGGITNGMPVVLRAQSSSPRPPSAGADDRQPFADGRDAACIIKGRHDPCIAHRAVRWWRR
jgi:chorismate synthase